jgi:hypothetical protein
MTNILPPISLYADDISTSDFISFLNENYPNNSFETVVLNREKKGRDGFGDFVQLLNTNVIVSTLFLNMVYDILKFGFLKLKKIPNSKPVVTIIMENGTETKIPMSLSNEEMRLEIVLLLSKGDIKSIEFDC